MLRETNEGWTQAYVTCHRGASLSSPRLVERARQSFGPDLSPLHVHFHVGVEVQN